jgi:hypothetical protein
MMGDEINIEKIEVCDDSYMVDLRNEETGQLIRAFIRKEALFALLCVAEKEAQIERGK